MIQNSVFCQFQGSVANLRAKIEAECCTTHWLLDAISLREDSKLLSSLIFHREKISNPPRDKHIGRAAALKQ